VKASGSGHGSAAADPRRRAAPGHAAAGGREGDGAIINWLSADDVKTVAPSCTSAAGKEIVARIFVCPIDDAGQAARDGRSPIART
jgi:hypothetical protein